MRSHPYSSRLELQQKTQRMTSRMQESKIAMSLVLCVHNIIGASLSEPHTSDTAVLSVCLSVLSYGTNVLPNIHVCQ